MEVWNCIVCNHYEQECEKVKKKFDSKHIDAMDPNWIQLCALWEQWEAHITGCRAWKHNNKVRGSISEFVRQEEDAD